MSRWGTENASPRSLYLGNKTKHPHWIRAVPYELCSLKRRNAEVDARKCKVHLANQQNGWANRRPWQSELHLFARQIYVNTQSSRNYDFSHVWQTSANLLLFNSEELSAPSSLKWTSSKGVVQTDPGKIQERWNNGAAQRLEWNFGSTGHSVLSVRHFVSFCWNSYRGRPHKELLSADKH